MSRWMIFGLCIATVAFVATIAGCPPSEEEVQVYDPHPPGNGYEDEVEPAAVVSEFEWTDSPTVDQIPDGPIVGMLNGRPFEAELVRVRKSDEDTYQLEILNKAPESGDPTAMVMGEDAWQLRFTRTEGETGAVEWAISDEKDFGTEHVYYWYAQGEGQGPMSVNHPWGAALEITEWTLSEDEENEKILGTVTGKIALVMNDDETSWCAGEFEAVYYEW